MEDTKYNGWTNYATWRVNLEMFDGFDVEYFTGGKTPEPVALASDLREYAENIITEPVSEQNLCRDYALAFLSDVNWHEIANNLIAAYAEG